MNEPIYAPTRADILLAGLSMLACGFLSGVIFVAAILWSVS